MFRCLTGYLALLDFGTKKAKLAKVGLIFESEILTVSAKNPSTMKTLTL